MQNETVSANKKDFQFDEIKILQCKIYAPNNLQLIEKESIIAFKLNDYINPTSHIHIDLSMDFPIELCN